MVLPAHSVSLCPTQLLPLLLRALDLPELDLRAHVIDTFSLLVQNSPDTFKDQIPTIVSALLENALCSDPSKDTEAGIVSLSFPCLS